MSSANPIWWTPAVEANYRERVRGVPGTRRVERGGVRVYAYIDLNFDTDKAFSVDVEVASRPYVSPQPPERMIAFDYAARDLVQAMLLVGRMKALLSAENLYAFFPDDSPRSVPPMPETRGCWNIATLLLDDSDAKIARALWDAYDAWRESSGNFDREGTSVARGIAYDDIFHVLQRKYVTRVDAHKQQLRALCKCAVDDLHALQESERVLAECLRWRACLGVHDSSNWLLPKCTLANVHDTQLMQLLN
jgi:hypothetical protein